MIRIGIVGCGFIGTVHSFALHQLIAGGLVDARVAATYDRDAAKAAFMAGHHEGAVAASTLDACLDAVDAVWVCTWTAGHLEPVEAAAARGMPIFCEKPLAPDLATAERLAAALCLVPHQVGLVLRHAPVFRTLAAEVASGRHGRVMAAQMRDDQYLPNQGIYGSTWRDDVSVAGGGTLIEHSIHDIDVLRWVLGDPIDVTARTGSLAGHPGIEDTATVLFSYPDGVGATLTSVWHQILSRPSTRRLEVFCEDALLWTDDDYLGPVHIETGDGAEAVEAELPDWVDRFTVGEALTKPLAQYAEPAKHFLDALSASGPAARGFPDAPAALAAHRLVDAAYRSAAAGCRPVSPA
ncbi:MAG: Gfo/Idh/MocA family oxidoreductase [Acidimicrobiia bacterium]|nr:Gfo/Idh/MocA family oxidoreductase [Acidimicrobiia bacterium]